jgi:hypothetical protein
LTLLKNCYNDNHLSGGYHRYCTSFFKTHFEKLPQSSEYLLETGEYIRRAAGNAESLPFFERSVKINNSDENCNHTGLYEAANGIMKLPKVKKRLSDLSNTILFNHCWETYKEELIEDTIYAKGAYLQKVCKAIKDKNVILPKENKCQN